MSTSHCLQGLRNVSSCLVGDLQERTPRSGIGWDEIQWDGMRWSGMGWDVVEWDGMGWRGVE